MLPGGSAQVQGGCANAVGRQSTAAWAQSQRVGEIVSVQQVMFGVPGEAAVAQPAVHRGRGATPVQTHVVVLAAPNPCGRCTLTLRYRPLKHWTAARLAQVHKLLTQYFRELGGFREADDGTVRLWHDALDTYTAEDLRWAIAAKTPSVCAATPERVRELRRYVTHPAAFVKVAAYWLERSPEFQARIARRRQAEDAQRAAALSANSRATRERVDGLCGAAVDREVRATAAREAEARRAAYWRGLSEDQRAAALAATRPAFRSRCEQWGTDPDSPDMEPVRVGMALGWASLKWPASDPIEEALNASQG